MPQRSLAFGSECIYRGVDKRRAEGCEYSLKNHGVNAEVDAIFEMGRETMALPLEEKLKYAQEDDGVGLSFG